MELKHENKRKDTEQKFSLNCTVMELKQTD